MKENMNQITVRRFNTEYRVTFAGTINLGTLCNSLTYHADHNYPLGQVVDTDGIRIAELPAPETYPNGRWTPLPALRPVSIPVEWNPARGIEQLDPLETCDGTRPIIFASQTLATHALAARLEALRLETSKML